MTYIRCFGPAFGSWAGSALLATLGAIVLAGAWGCSNATVDSSGGQGGGGNQAAGGTGGITIPLSSPGTPHPVDASSLPKKLGV